MDMTKKLAPADQLRRDIDSAVEKLIKRGLTRAAAMDKVILSPEVSQAHRRERQEAALEEQMHGRVSKDTVKAADEAIDALAEQYRIRHPGMSHAQCVAHVLTATPEGKRLYEESRRERLRKAALIG